MRKVTILATLFATFAMTVFVIPFGGLSVAFATEIQDGENAGMLEGIPACSNSFIKSLNKSNTVMWVNDPASPYKSTPCCINGRVCQPYPAYQQYVVANTAFLQPEYDCSKIAKENGYTPICQVVVGEALDPTTICTACVPYRFTFWAPVYQNNNKPKPPEPEPSPDPKPRYCNGKICTGKTWCVNGRCVQVR